MRVNINYVLERGSEQNCRLLNKKLCNEFSDCEIDFEHCRPHMTCLMGEIDEKNFEYVQKTISLLKFEAVGKTYKMEKAHVSDNYILADAKEVEPFVADCKNILNVLGDIILPHRFCIANGT